MYQPLADKIRPRELDEMVGQEHIIGEGGILRRILARGEVPNMIFYGPSGVGKTTLAQDGMGMDAMHQGKPPHIWSRSKSFKALLLACWARTMRSGATPLKFSGSEAEMAR